MDDISISKRITSLRFILIVLIVFIHNQLNDVSFSNEVLVITIPKYCEIIRTIISEIVGRVSVPFLYLISGYLLFSKERSYKNEIIKKCKTLLIPYILWTTLVILFYFIAESIPKTSIYFANPQNIVKNWSLLDFIDAFLGFFTIRKPYPLVFQFWFLRDLIILNLVFPILLKIVRKFSFFIYGVAFILWFLNFDLIFISSEALFFFILGIFISDKIEFIQNYEKKISVYEIILVYLFGIILEIIYKGNTSIHKINILLGVVFLWKFSIVLIRGKLFNVLNFLSFYSFWIFCFHEPLQTILKKLFVKLFPISGIWNLLEYFIISILVISISLLSGILVDKLCPLIFNILTGSRKRR